MTTLDDAIKASTHVHETRGLAQRATTSWIKDRRQLLQQGSDAAIAIANKADAEGFVIVATENRRPPHGAEAIQFEAGQECQIYNHQMQEQLVVLPASLVLLQGLDGAIAVYYYPPASSKKEIQGRKVLVCDPGKLKMAELIYTFAIAAAHDDWTNSEVFRSGLATPDWTSAVM